MSDFAIQPERQSHRHAWQLPWQLSWPLRRSLASLRQRLRPHRLHRQTVLMLHSLDERLLYDIGLDPLELIEPIRRSRPLPGTTQVRHR